MIRTLLRLLRLLRFPRLELGPFGAAFSLFLLDLVEFLLLIRFQQVAYVSFGFLVVGRHLVFHGFLVCRREFFQVLLDHLATLVHLLAHDLADLIALFAGQIELAVGAFAVFAVHLTAVAWAVERATHRATILWHGHGDGGQSGSEHQSDKSLAHGVSPCLVPGTFRMSTDYGDQGQRRSALRKAWVKTLRFQPYTYPL
ncbi:membrane hypothetical protein [Pseudomonas sp. IT-P260]